MLPLLARHLTGPADLHTRPARVNAQAAAQKQQQKTACRGAHTRQQLCLPSRPMHMLLGMPMLTSSRSLLISSCTLLRALSRLKSTLLAHRVQQATSVHSRSACHPQSMCTRQLS